MKNKKVALNNILKFQSGSTSLTEFAKEVIQGNEFTFQELADKFKVSINISRARIDTLKDRGFIFKERKTKRGVKKLKCVDCSAWSPKPRNQKERKEPEHSIKFVKKASIDLERYVDSQMNKVFGAS